MRSLLPASDASAQEKLARASTVHKPFNRTTTTKKRQKTAMATPALVSVVAFKGLSAVDPRIASSAVHAIPSTEKGPRQSPPSGGYGVVQGFMDGRSASSICANNAILVVPVVGFEGLSAAHGRTTTTSAAGCTEPVDHLGHCGTFGGCGAIEGFVGGQSAAQAWAAHATTLLANLRAEGLHLHLDNAGHLLVHPASALTEDHRQAIRVAHCARHEETQRALQLDALKFRLG